MDRLPIGSNWRKWDLHFHTPASYDHDNKSVTNEDIVEALIAADIKLVAITDHHIIDVDRIKALQKLGENHFTVLPGIELRSDQGSPSVHYICLFPEHCDLSDVWTKLQGTLGLTVTDIVTKGGNDRVYVPISEAARITKELGGVISIHAGNKSNSIENIKNEEQYQQRIKYDVTEKHIDFFEVGQIKDITDYLDIVFPTIGLERPLIIGSDNHDPNNYATKSNCWIKADPTFRGLKQTIKEPRERVFIGEYPPIFGRVEQNKTKYISSLEIRKTEDSTLDEVWFDQVLKFNHGLVAIIGNKGSGKSALVDILGLLGNSKHHDTFEFLTERKFKNLKKNKATHFNATLTWESGDANTVNLNDEIDEAAVETIKYIPQHHLETICNELESGGESRFQNELQSVIFSHVRPENRLGYDSLTDLINYRTEECQQSIKQIANELHKESLELEKLEELADPFHRKSLESQLKEKQKELISHNKSKPPEIKQPSADEKTKNVVDKTTAEIDTKVKLWESLEREIAEIRDSIINQTKILAEIDKFKQQVSNLKSFVESFKNNTREQLNSIGLKLSDVLHFSINMKKVEKIKSQTSGLIENLELKLSKDDENSTVSKLKTVSIEVSALREKLDKPNKDYQLYRKAKAEWEKRKTDIIGDEHISGSIEGIKHKTKELDELPELINDSLEKLKNYSIKIYKEKEQLTIVYSELYGPVQKFIEQHHVAQGKFNLEFNVSITEHGFVEKFLLFINQNRKGSFQGKEEGETVLRKIVGSADYQNEDSFVSFLDNIILSLRRDKRKDPDEVLLLKQQLRKESSVSEIIQYLFSLDYLEPKYVLRWEGKDLEQLSPGERGTLLLIFYLLVDGNDIPLIIDQPEGNLDNFTVAKVLIDCVKEAKKQRQVFLVTHNPNLAVACDAEQIVYANLEKGKGNTLKYATGSLENPGICQEVIRVLEGSKPVFDLRGYKYTVGELL